MAEQLYNTKNIHVITKLRERFNQIENEMFQLQLRNQRLQWHLNHLLKLYNTPGEQVADQEWYDAWVDVQQTLNELKDGVVGYNQ